VTCEETETSIPILRSFKSRVAQVASANWVWASLCGLVAKLIPCLLPAAVGIQASFPDLPIRTVGMVAGCG
jgi:hypothetical protein